MFKKLSCLIPFFLFTIPCHPCAINIIDPDTLSSQIVTIEKSNPNDTFRSIGVGLLVDADKIYIVGGQGREENSEKAVLWITSTTGQLLQKIFLSDVENSYAIGVTKDNYYLYISGAIDHDAHLWKVSLSNFSVDDPTLIQEDSEGGPILYDNGFIYMGLDRDGNPNPYNDIFKINSSDFSQVSSNLLPNDSNSRVYSILKGAGTTLYFTATSGGPIYTGSWLYNTSDFSTFNDHQLSDQNSSYAYAAIFDDPSVFVSGESILWKSDGTNVSSYPNTSFYRGIGIEKAGNYLYILSGAYDTGFSEKLVKVSKTNLVNSESELKFPYTFFATSITYSNEKIYVTGASFGENPTLQEALKVFSPIKYQ